MRALRARPPPVSENPHRVFDSSNHAAIGDDSVRGTDVIAVVDLAGEEENQIVRRAGSKARGTPADLLDHLRSV